MTMSNLEQFGSVFIRLDAILAVHFLEDTGKPSHAVCYLRSLDELKLPRTEAQALFGHLLKMGTVARPLLMLGEWAVDARSVLAVIPQPDRSAKVLLSADGGRSLWITIEPPADISALIDRD